MLIYFSFGLLNYKIFGNLTQENILIVLPQDMLGNIVRIFYGISLLFTIPLQILPCRYYLSKIIKLEDKILSAFIFLLSFLLIICEVKIQILFNLAGGIFSSLINFVFPAFFFLKMKKRFLITKIMQINLSYHK
ncbi:transmembrane amino acid transporter protein [Tubulinosema ratisbonensis]|uniref:Transmembrane amino acid transporter protein n=1 Tax=Tubulinosema ratisbonensis TaxID=291195 RepID=A0A437AHN4_9MICR|nr:transmembrane amino acid transporter protein [Tubulinosema ratisbonensis]